MSRELRAAVVLGGMVGTFLRWLVAELVDIGSFPLATLLVNLAGAYALARLGSWFVRCHPVQRAFLTVGVLGSFTTFSAVAVDVVRLGDAPFLAGSYAFATLAGGYLAVRLGRGQNVRPRLEVGA